MVNIANPLTKGLNRELVRESSKEMRLKPLKEWVSMKENLIQLTEDQNIWHHSYLLVSMGEFFHDDICEQILVRLDVEDLIRYKSVCKSWKSLISHPRFVKAHQKRQVNLIPYRMGIIPNYLSKYGAEHYMVGSSNGLACINSFDGDEIIVANPWTREERMLQKLPVSPERSCWGFGYDALTDDYKVLFGAAESFEKTAFHVFSLKSNVWKHVGHVNYRFWGDVQIGTLCNGALHWIGYQVTKGFIISFDLSKEVFKEINQPDDVIHKCSSFAINKGYVCNYNEYHEKLLVMKKYNVKQYWKYRGRYLCTLGMQSKEPYAFIPSTVMPSLISPYLQEGNE
ncbi:putative F-box domain-containing protein [Tanacetum coccineum]